MSEIPDDEASIPVEAEPALPGQRLRQARELRGLSVQQVASNLHLGVKVINALEQDDYSSLPSMTFVSGYLRAYARLLEIPETELKMPGQGMAAPPLVSSVVSATQPSTGDFPIRLISMIIIVLLIASIVFWWVNNGDALMFERQHEPSHEPMMSLPLGQQRPLPLESVPPVPMTPDNQVESDAVLDHVAEQTVNTAEPAKPVAVAPEVPKPEPAQVPVVLQAEVELRYSAESWTEISDNKGDQLAFGLIEAGTVLKVKGEAPFRIMLGYAPGVSVYFNDELFDHSPFQRRDIARFRLGGPEHNRPVSR